MSFKIKGTLIVNNTNAGGVAGTGRSFTIKLISELDTLSFPDDSILPTKHAEPALDGAISTSLPGQSTIPLVFDWRLEWGLPGAFQIWNHDPLKQFLLVSLTLEFGQADNLIHFVCNSWVYPENKYQWPRTFFANKSYLPSQTPSGLSYYREKELRNLRGDGTGERQEWERIYDYAYYNDLGNPDKSPELARPVLGGSTQYPYPRRGRTGRPPTQTDPNSESPQPGDKSFEVYVPRDDQFSDRKLFEFISYFPKSLVNSLKPFMKAELEAKGRDFESFEDVREVLFTEGFKFPVPKPILDALAAKLPIEVPSDGILVLQFPTPFVIKENLDGWMTDEEFAREILAGVNPNLIRLLQEFPPKSKLDTNLYGDQTCSKITKEQLEINLNGLTVDQALQSKRLFILDHHDSFMPYLRRINEISRKGYATRVILFKKDDETLKPLAIELSLPHPKGDKFGAVSTVYLPAEEGVEGSLWLLAKGYVTVNDSSYHQLVSHWLNTHAVIEPFVLATNRQLSALHPIHKLLLPHFHDTMFINALARQTLISADGIIESSFLPGKYSFEFTSQLYKNWVFPEQALPADLIKRGMAVEDSESPHGLRLLIKDYPYAVDGLDIWAAIKTWVQDYVSSYYETDATVRKDSELQSWWKELVEVGHGDLKDKPWWPKMQTREELIESCTIIIWISSALHAAINFGQFPYGGYILNRPTLSRRFLPQEGTQEYEELVKNPKLAFLKTITPKFETLIDLSVIEILSGHTSDEVYLGTRNNPNWTSDVKPLEAFQKFAKKMIEIEETLIRRNKDKTLKNRVGPVKMPYTLLYPSSEQGLTGRGIPNSISI